MSVLTKEQHSEVVATATMGAILGALGMAVIACLAVAALALAGNARSATPAASPASSPASSSAAMVPGGMAGMAGVASTVRKAASYQPHARNFTVSVVPLAVGEQAGLFDYLKSDFAPGGLLDGKEIYGMNPSSLTVYEGDTVTIHWVNPADDEHPITVSGGLSASIDLKGQSTADMTLVASQVGIFAIQCVMPEHAPYMNGQLIVLPAAFAPVNDTSAAVAPATAVPADVSSVSATVVNATLSDTMKITLDRTTVPAGPVTFNVKNAGAIVHELVLLHTDVAEDKIPADAQNPGMVDESTSLGEMAADMPAGTSKTFTITLAAGNYVVICNEIGHYMAGMHSAFTVK